MKTIKFLQEKLDLIREELCKLIGIDPNLQKKRPRRKLYF